jgi:L-lactate dehydrogenase
VRRDIDGKVRGAAYTIIGGEGATYHNIGSILDVVLHDQRAVLTVCAAAPEVAGVRDVTVALPRLVGEQGVLETFPLPPDRQETALLHGSAGVVRGALDGLGGD